MSLLLFLFADGTSACVFSAASDTETSLSDKSRLASSSLIYVRNLFGLIFIVFLKARQKCCGVTPMLPP